MKALLICVLIMLGNPQVYARQSAYDPAAKTSTSKRESFVDCAFKGINPSDKDYGCEIDQARKLLVDETVKNFDSWAVWVALSFLILSFCMVLHQHQERNRRELIASRFLAQYHNAWINASSKAEDAIREYNDLAKSMKIGKEALADMSPIALAGNTHADLKHDVGRETATQNPLRGKVRNENLAATPDGVLQNSRSELDLIEQIDTLQQQLSAAHEREKKLQKELTKAGRRTPRPQNQESNLSG